MNRSSFAFLIALLVHLLFILTFWLMGIYAPELHKDKKPEKNKIKISLKEFPIKSKDSGLTKKKMKQPKIAPPMPKGAQLKKIVKKPPIKYQPKKQKVRKVKLNKPKKPLKKKIVQKKQEPIPSNKPYIPLLKKPIEQNLTKIEKPKKELDPLYALLSEDKSNEENLKEIKKSQNGSSINQNIKELYGSEFGKLTPGQQKYILDNQEIMRRITQQVLNRVARVNITRDLNVNVNNVVEFYLHPNGDMTDFRFLQKSGYYILDDTTKETIEYAYSKYPRPKEKTLIRYNVYYNLSRY
jgi:outer membrane biosynthesis protein TonB